VSLISEVNRSFSPFRETDESEADYELWFHFDGPKGKGLSWGDLLKKRLVVILGEAGIGKTFEFQNQAKVLVARGKL
jgi:hypothetical protein